MADRDGAERLLLQAFIDLDQRFKGHFGGEWINATMGGLVVPELDDSLGPEDYVDFAVSCHVDDGASQRSQATGNPRATVKPTGSPSLGVALTMPDRACLCWFVGKGRRAASYHRYIAYEDVLAVNELTFSYKWNSLLGLEIMLVGDQRVAIMFSEKLDYTWSRDILRRRLDGTFIPLFENMGCSKWVAPGSEGDPVDESGVLRHQPYVA
jgi:hypothetical protein